MGSMICMNKVCRTTTSSEWKEGWSLKSGGFANLCYNCGSAFENLAFCETFHMGVSGWRVCKMCGKHLHCGCIASQHLFEYLDSGGVGCISCTRRLDGHSMRPMQYPLYRDQEQWAQCDSCSKRRRLPMHVLLPPKWTCSDNIWDSNRCSCSAPEEIKAKELEAFFRVAKGCVSKTGGRGRVKSPSKRSIKRIKTFQEDELQKSIVAEVETKLLQVAEGENAGEEQKEKENEEEIEKENKKEMENVLGGNAREEETEREKEKETEKEKEEETEREKEKETEKEEEEETEKEREEEEEETIVDEGEEEADIGDEATIANTEEEASREEEYEEEEEAVPKRRKKKKNDNAPSQSVEVVEGENAGEEEKVKENEEEIEKENKKETENVLGGNTREEETEKEKEKETEKEREEEEEETIVDEGEEASIANTEEEASREEKDEEEAAAKRRKKRKNDNAPSQSVEDEMPEDEFDSCEVEILKLRPEIPPLKYKIFLDDNETFNKKITVRSSLGLAGMGEFRKLLQDEGLENKFRSSPFGHFLDLPERPLFQASIVHALLLRRVFCEKTQELWFDYKRLPVCFGLREFAIMTGLNCGHSITNSKLKKYLVDGGELWNLISKGKRSVTGKIIFELIKSGSNKIKKYKFGLCLIWFVHCILLAKDSKCGVSEATVRLASTEEAFYNYPWGRNCFRLTVDYLMKDMKERQQSKGDSYNLYGFPWAFMAWAFEAIPQLRPKDYPKERTLPRMKRWLFEKLEKDRPDPFHIKDRPVVHPFLYPTKDEKMEPYIQNLVILSDKKDMMIDNLSKELDGVTVLRHLGGALKTEKGSLQTPQVGNSHVVGGYDDRIEKSIGGDGKVGGEAVDDDDGDGGMHFNDDDGGGEGSNYDDGRGAASIGKKGDEIKNHIVAGTSSIHCPCICPDCLEKEKKEIKWRDDMQCQLNSMQKTMDDLVQKLSK